MNTVNAKWLALVALIVGFTGYASPAWADCWAAAGYGGATGPSGQYVGSRDIGTISTAPTTYSTTFVGVSGSQCFIVDPNVPGSNILTYYFQVNGTDYMAQIDVSFTPPADAYVEPKYAILGVFYAPPCGNSGNLVQYGTSYISSTDTSISQSFSTSITATASDSGSIIKGFSYEWSLTGNWTSTSTSGTDIKTSTTTSENYSVPGCTTAPDGVNHEYDRIAIWLNPMVPYYYDSTTAAVYVADLAVDTRDPASETGAPDVVSLTVSQLQALEAGDTSGIAPGTLSSLSRSWDTTWNGPGTPGLQSTDYASILAADPFAADPTLDPDTMSRFTPVTGVSFPYAPQSPPTHTTYTVSTSSTTTAVSGVEDSHSVTAETGGKFGNFGLKVSYQWTWENKWNTSNTTGTTQNATVTVYTPSTTDSPPYTGPVTLLPYLDNVYGTYVLFPE